jgi:rhodanese-related sulfurtransferase
MADRLTGTVHGPGRAHRQAVSPEVDGCDHNYVDGGGTRSICLPLHAPGTKPVTCAYLAQHGFTKVKVAPHGQNRKKLPVGKGGFVCQP